MRRKRKAALSKEEIRRLVLDKLQVVYEDWGLQGPPFAEGPRPPGGSRDDTQAFMIALVAALVGGFSEVIALNAAARSGPGRARTRLRSIRELEGYRVQGVGQSLGDVVDAYFDDHTWTVRYLLLDAVGAAVRRGLLSPHSLRHVDRRARVMLAALTPPQLATSPAASGEASISRRAETGVLQYYGFPYYWTGGRRWGAGDRPQPLAPTPESAAPEHPADHVVDTGVPTDAHLRSVRDFRHYVLHATDGELGRVDDLLVEDHSWAIRYIVVDTRRWWPGSRVLLAPEWVTYVSWVERSVHVSLDQATIRTAPMYDRGRPIDRVYEARLHEHYGRPKYWQPHAA